jgi:hypothetical protein
MTATIIRFAYGDIYDNTEKDGAKHKVFECRLESILKPDRAERRGENEPQQGALPTSEPLFLQRGGSPPWNYKRSARWRQKQYSARLCKPRSRAIANTHSGQSDE